MRPAALARDRRRPCIACATTEIACRALARHRGRPCCITDDHEPPEEETP